MTKRDGTTVISFAYDALNRMSAKTFAAPWTSLNVAYGYDLAGRPLAALYANQSGTPGVTWTYDAAGRRITEATNSRALSFTYDADDNPATMTWPDGVSMTYAFDAADRFSSVGAGGASVSAGYDSLSRMISVARGGVSTTVGYDNADRMVSLAHAFAGGSGNQSWSPIAYTPADQVAGVTSANSAWDWPGAAASSTTTKADGLNRNAGYASVGAPCAPSGAGYDCNGNLTFDGTRTFAYDPENRLLTESGPSLTLSYDPMGRLQQSVAGGATTQFLYDGDALVAEYQAGAVTARYVHGPAADNPVIAFAGATASAATASYLIADRQGSIVATANNAGALGAVQTYDAYGVPNTWNGTRFRYTGQISIPGAQLYYYKARVYDPVQGRFLQTDPVGYGPDVNWYAYVGNDPVNKGDPTGNHPQYEISNFGQWEDAEDDTLNESGQTPVGQPAPPDKSDPSPSKPQSAAKAATDPKGANPPQKKGSAGRLNYDQMRELVKKYNQSDQSDQLIMAVAWKESRFKPEGKNPGSSATGLMGIERGAIMDANKALGTNYTLDQMRDAASNITVGSEYLQIRVDRAGGNVIMGLDNYGTGPGYSRNILSAEHDLKANPGGGEQILIRDIGP